MHAFITLVIPYSVDCLTAVEAVLEELGNPCEADLRHAIDNCERIHFLSGSTLAVDAKAFLILEGSADDDADSAIDALAKAAEQWLIRLLDAAGLGVTSARLAHFLKRHSHDFGVGWFSIPGLVFSGAPQMTLKRIRAEAELAKHITQILSGAPRKPNALEKLNYVRKQLKAERRWAWALKAEPTPFLRGPQGTLFDAKWTFVWGACVNFLWPLILLNVIFFCVSVWMSWGVFGTCIAIAIGVGVVFLEMIATLLFAWFVYSKLRTAENTDMPDDAEPPASLVRDIMRRENSYTQNHLFAVSIMKPGVLRRTVMRAVLFVIGVMARKVYAPGHLGRLGTIHFARFFLLPGTDRFMFYSNYGGGWESYLEDFIELAHAGLTGVWSNTIGFPRTRNIFQDGATDGDRFKRWARRQQRPTLFWYSAYPELTTANIRANAAIRQGLGAVALESEAANWLACFGSAPPPANQVEAQNVQAIVMNAMRRLPHGACFVGRLPEDGARARAWLDECRDEVTFGGKALGDRAMILTFSASGLRALGLSEETLATFAVAFQHGMTESWRARMLGDVGRNAPENWRWGGATYPVDFAMLIYARSASTLAKRIDAERARLTQHGGDAQVISLAELPYDDTKKANNGDNDVYAKETPEPFGFRDGISQPIIRGLRPATLDDNSRDRDHLVAPGEFILGYPDNRGFLPPTSIVPATQDPDNILPRRETSPSRSRVDFASCDPNEPHDFGRNGSYIVIRQLEQDHVAFDLQVEAAAKSLKGKDELPVSEDALPEWIAAKIVGRWKNGNSLVKYPFEEGKHVKPGREDNRFRFGEDDPSGLRCPFGAHIRRANPRDDFDPGNKEQLAITNRHRILRVGRPYREEGQEKNRGLLFLCLNGDIQRQFEFVQQSWISNTGFRGLLKEGDPVMVSSDSGTDGAFTIPTPAGPLVLKGLENFVTVRGGGYFFLPSRQALAFLASEPDPKLVDRPRGL